MMKKKADSDFLRYLKSASEMTAGWPEWKKEALKPSPLECDKKHGAKMEQSRHSCAKAY